MELSIGDLLLFLSKTLGPAATPIALLGWWMWWRSEAQLKELRERERDQAAEYAASINSLTNVVRWLRFMVMQGRTPTVQQYELESVQELLAVNPPELLREPGR